MKTFKELLNNNKSWPNNRTWPNNNHANILARALVFWALHSAADLRRDDALEALVALAAIAYYRYKDKRSTLFGEMPTECYNNYKKSAIFPLPRHAITSDLLQRAKDMRDALENDSAPDFSSRCQLAPDELACLVEAELTVYALQPCHIGELIEGVELELRIQKRKKERKNNSQDKETDSKEDKEPAEGEHELASEDSFSSFDEYNEEIDEYFKDRAANM